MVECLMYVHEKLLGEMCFCPHQVLHTICYKYLFQENALLKCSENWCIRLAKNRMERRKPVVRSSVPAVDKTKKERERERDSVYKLLKYLFQKNALLECFENWCIAEACLYQYV